MKKTIRKYSVCSAAIALATMASLGTAGNARAEHKELKDYPDPTHRISSKTLGDNEVRKYLHELRDFLKGYLKELEEKQNNLDLWGLPDLEENAAKLAHKDL
ncbi:hypothetical protein [Streptococcus equi]|uniref:hypothetical protein n=1 Tax=Streptococcus equi TaxID=1336 RepID=UPI001E65C7D5|nr:hypothetical protein [Streptococcus equi]